MLNAKNIISLIIILFLFGPNPLLAAGEKNNSVGVSPSELNVTVESGKKIEQEIFLSRSFNEGQTGFDVSLAENSPLIILSQPEAIIPDGQNQTPYSVTIDASQAKPGDYSEAIVFTMQKTYGQSGAVLQYQLKIKTSITVTKAPLNYYFIAMLTAIGLAVLIILVSAGLFFQKRKINH